MNNTAHNKYNATARSKRRAVVGITLALSIITLLSFQWYRTSTPKSGNSIGSGTVLNEDVIAVATLYNNAKNNEFISRAKAHLLVNKDFSTVILKKNGEIIAISEKERPDFIQNTSRPHGWFIPGTVGVLHIKEGNTVKAIRITANSSRINANLGSSAKRMASFFPKNAITGLRIECKNDCEPINIAKVDLSIPPNIQNFDFITIMEGKNEQSLFTFSPDVPISEVEGFAIKLAEFASPINTERELANGVVVNEITPNTNLTKIELETEGIIAYGNDNKSIYFASNDSFSYISTSEKLINDALNKMSTPAWTNKICAQVPSAFFPVNFSSTFAENPTSPLYIINTKRSWSICENS